VTTSDLLSGLDAEQREAVTAPESLLAVLAAAGSGKTTVITRRIAHRVLSEEIDERHVLALAFTRQAAGELRRRLVELGVRGELTVGTFHSVAYGLLRRRWADQSRPAPALLANRAGYLRDVLGESRRFDVAGLAAELDWMRAQALDPEQYAAVASERGRRPVVPPTRIAELVSAYDLLKRKRGVVDFDDLLAIARDELRRDTTFADATRWRFRHLVVDEFQDINPAQFALLELIRGDRTDVCVVGDPRQAIYGWNGSDPTLLDEIEQRYRGVRVLRLRTNYRCAPAVVAAAGEVLSSTGRVDDSVTVRPPGPSVVLLGTPDEAAEAHAVARRARDLRRVGGRWRSIAVLARTNAQLGPIAAALTAAGVPTMLGSARRSGVDDELRALLADARDLGGPTALRTWATDLASGIDGEAAATPLHHELAASVRRFLDASPAGTGRMFAEWYAVDAAAPPTADGVELLTFHAAKGREWPSVIVSGVEVGLVPHPGAAGAAGAEEEIRLLYVAMTRAADELTITWAERRNGRAAGRSPLLQRVWENRDVVRHGEHDDDPTVPFGEAGPAVPSVVAATRQRHSEGTSDPVLAELRRWRERAARAARLPEGAICSDTELGAIAAARPTTIDELLDVPGISPMAARRLGPRLLDVVASVGGVGEA